MSYNPYSAINAIYNLKNDWATADKSGDTKARDKAAENAKTFYNQLRNNGYGSVADDLSSVDVSGAKYILDQYSSKNTGVDNPAYNTTMQGAVDKNNVYAGYIDSDRKDVQGKYNDIYNYANQDITKTDEYKSTYNSIMGKYDMSALQGRDNAAASGGASNGGNIDSYAAANAMRQQASLTATGQQIAHQAGLDAANARVANVSNILNNLGVYNTSTYDAMNQTVNNDLNIANSYFTNAETAKNNEAARQKVYSDISGTVGDTVTKYLNSNTWNADGSLVNYGQDFQANINELEKALSTTTDPAERARILEQLRVNEMARNQKIDEQGLTYGKTYKYQSNQQTEAADQFDKTMDYNYYATDVDYNKTTNTNATQERMNTANNQNNIDQITTTALYSQAATGQITEAQMDEVAKDINDSYKDVLGENIIAKVGNKYVVKNNYGGAVARYMMSQYFKDGYQTAAWMQAMFGTPPEDTAVAIGLTQGNKPHDWEKAYNPADYNLN